MIDVSVTTGAIRSEWATEYLEVEPSGSYGAGLKVTGSSVDESDCSGRGRSW